MRPPPLIAPSGVATLTLHSQGNLTQPAEEFKRMMANGTLSGALSSADLAKLSSMGAKELLHPNTVNRHDGNVCGADEESHQGMCYQKCSLLTSNAYPIRSTAWSFSCVRLVAQ